MADGPSAVSGAPGVGVPLVDLTATVQGLLDHAEQAREHRAAFLAWADRYADSIASRADYLENLATILAGGTTP